MRYLEDGTRDRSEQHAGVCNNCRLKTHQVPCGRERSPAAPVFLACILCNRWLCKLCPFDQSVGHCIKCPGVQHTSGGHWGVNLRMQHSAKPWKAIVIMLKRADKLSEEAGTLCKKAGQVGQYHTTSAATGRGARVAQGFMKGMLAAI